MLRVSECAKFYPKNTEQYQRVDSIGFTIGKRLAKKPSAFSQSFPNFWMYRKEIDLYKLLKRPLEGNSLSPVKKKN